MTGNLAEQVLNNRYQITERIGLGGMAEVYRAQDNVLGRMVAVKVMLPQYAEDATFAARFRQEAAAAANLQSPYIVNVYDWGQDSGTYYIVMEFVRGSDLKTAINQRGAINQRKVAEIGSQVCQALSVAHGMDIIHRDIKPQNIMVQPDGNVKVMDFGIARAKNSLLAKTSAVLGTAHYISPEQAQGKDLTPASDIYSLGVVLYESVTGKLPFDGPDAVSVAMKQVQETPLPPSQVNPDIDPGLEDIILKAMSKNPLDRFATALDMRRALNDFLAGRTVNVGGFNGSNAPTVANAVPFLASTERAYAEDATSVMPQIDSTPRVSSASPLGSNNYLNTPEKKNRKKAAFIAIGIIAAVVALSAIAFALFNLGGESVEVPDVTGLTFEEATAELEKAGFSVAPAEYVYNADVEEGKVAGQNPRANSKAAKGSKVTLSVSRGAEQTEVPDLSNMTPDEARQALSKQGLKYEAGAAEYSSDVAEGRVARQNPAAGTKIAKGETVTCYLSAGEEGTVVPDVTGKSASQAEVILENAGFKVKTEESASDSVGNGNVISTTPAAGTKAKSGSTVLVTISSGKSSYQVTGTANQGGTVTGGGSVKYGGSVTLSYKANAGYQAASAYDQYGESYPVSGTSGTITVSNVTADTTVTITFEATGNEGGGGESPGAGGGGSGNKPSG